MKEVMTQGAILNNVRSSKYPDVRCRGIVITPRCDIANEKVSNIYYLTAVTVREWIECIWIKKKLIDKEKSDRGNIKSIINDYELDLDVLISLNKNEVIDKVLCERISDTKRRIQVKDFLDFEKYIDNIYNSGINRSEINYIMKKCKVKSKDLSKSLDDLFNGVYSEYCLVEFVKSKIEEVLIVDLREIRVMSFEIFKVICENGIDYQEQTIINSLNCNDFIQSNFYFESDDDFIMVDGPIDSPWMENLVQRYYILNTRIGVDNYDEETRRNFYAKIWEEYRYE